MVDHHLTLRAAEEFPGVTHPTHVKLHRVGVQTLDLNTYII